jgi:hypothetical protein
MDDRDELSEQIGGIVERHGDEIADEVVKTSRLIRGMTVGMFVIFVLLFIVVLGVIVWVVTQL